MSEHGLEIPDAGDLVETVARMIDKPAWRFVDEQVARRPDIAGYAHSTVLRHHVARSLETARAAIRETLAALREPSAPMLACGTLAAATTGDIAPEHAEQVEMQRRTIEQASRGAFRSAFRQAVRVFARQHGLQMPRGGPQEPGGGHPGPGTENDASGSGTASGAPPPPHRKPGGHAT